MVRMDADLRDKAAQEFYDKWQNQTLVLDKWFAAQAASPLAGDGSREVMSNKIIWTTWIVLSQIDIVQ